MTYVQLALVGDVDTLTDIGKTYMEQSMGPNWVARPGNPESIMIESSGQIAAEVVEQASLVPPEAYSALGTSIYGIPFQEGTRATMDAVITFASDTPATMVPDTAQVAVPHPSGNSLIFLTDRDVLAPLGGGNMPVSLIALDTGEDYNNCFGNCELIEIVEGVSAIVASQAVGGTNDETATEYLDRLSDYLTIPRRPVLPEDHATLALQVPGVGRATAYNLFYPGTTESAAGRAVGDYALWQPQPPPAASQSNVARCTTVAIMGVDGADPSTELMNQVYGVLDANREINFLNFVVKPTYTSVDVKSDVKSYSGLTPDETIQSATDAIKSWLDPATWGAPPGVSAGTWEADTKVRLYEAVDYINRGQGIWYCENVQLKLHSDSVWQSADIQLPGISPMPTYGDILINPI